MQFKSLLQKPAQQHHHTRQASTYDNLLTGATKPDRVYLITVVIARQSRHVSSYKDKIKLHGPPTTAAPASHSTIYCVG